MTIQASVGIALGQPRQHGADELLRDADLAMYMAKHNGKGRFELFEPAMHRIRRSPTPIPVRPPARHGERTV